MKDSLGILVELDNVYGDAETYYKTGNGDKLTENRIAILRLIAGNPYISQSELAESIGVSITAISNNIKAMRNKYLRRVGPDKGGFWEIIR